MKKVLIASLLTLLLSACGTGGDWTISNGGNGTVGLSLSSLKLNYDFKEYQVAYLDDDLIEFRNCHNVPYNAESKYSGTISSFQDILNAVSCSIEESRRPSITLTLNCPDTVITKSFLPNEVVGNSLYNIDEVDFVATGTIEVKTIKTFMYSMQVLWRESASYPNWPIKAMNKDGKVSGTAPKVVKSGTSSSGYQVGARMEDNSLIILNNTINFDSSNEEDYGDHYSISDAITLCPTLSNSIYSGGEFCDNIAWDLPVIINIVQ